MVQLTVSGDYVTVTVNGSIQEEVNKTTDAIEYNKYSDGKVSLSIGRRSFEMVDPTIFEIAGVAVTDASDFVTKLTAVFGSGGGASYLVYTALLSQTGTAAPVATVLENTLGGAVVWTRNAAGDYRGTLAGIFITDKVFFVIHCGESTGLFVTAGIVSVNEIYLDSYSIGFFDSLLINTSVEIRVYP